MNNIRVDPLRGREHLQPEPEHDDDRRRGDHVAARSASRCASSTCAGTSHGCEPYGRRTWPTSAAASTRTGRSSPSSTPRGCTAAPSDDLRGTERAGNQQSANLVPADATSRSGLAEGSRSHAGDDQQRRGGGTRFETFTAGDQYFPNIPNRRSIGRRSRASSRTSPLRAPAVHPARWAAETMMDELAYAANMDALAFRQAHTTHDGWRPVLDKVAKPSRTGRRACPHPQLSNERFVRRPRASRSAARTTPTTTSTPASSPRSRSTARPARSSSSTSTAHRTSGVIVNPASAENQITGMLIRGVSRTIYRAGHLLEAAGHRPRLGHLSDPALQGDAERDDDRDRRTRTRSSTPTLSQTGLAGPALPRRRRVDSRPSSRPRSATPSSTQPACACGRSRSRRSRCGTRSRPQAGSTRASAGYGREVGPAAGARPRSRNLAADAPKADVVRFAAEMGASSAVSPGPSTTGTRSGRRAASRRFARQRPLPVRRARCCWLLLPSVGQAPSRGQPLAHRDLLRERRRHGHAARRHARRVDERRRRR